MERIAMGQEEREKLEWLKRAKDKVISQRKAAERMGVSDRWVRKLLQRMKRQGDGAVVHGLRGRTSNRKIAARLEAQAIELLKQPEWHDFGPTFAAEQLAKRHIAGGRAGAPLGSWCSGTPPSTTGWKDAGRCVIWCV